MLPICFGAIIVELVGAGHDGAKLFPKVVKTREPAVVHVPPDAPLTGPIHRPRTPPLGLLSRRVSRRVTRGRAGGNFRKLNPARADLEC